MTSIQTKIYTWNTTEPRYLFCVAARPAIKETGLCDDRNAENRVLQAMWQHIKLEGSYGSFQLADYQQQSLHLRKEHSITMKRISPTRSQQYKQRQLLNDELRNLRPGWLMLFHCRVGA